MNKTFKVIYWGFFNIPVKGFLVAAAFIYGVATVAGADHLGKYHIAAHEDKVYCASSPVATSDSDSAGNVAYSCTVKAKIVDVF
jgi:hypothetical protein